MQRYPKIIFYLCAGLCFFACRQENTYVDWPDYLGGPDRNHYSQLSQINKENLHLLKPVWTYKTPDSGQMQMNPLVIDGVVYGVSASLQAFALDGATGAELWRFGNPLKVWYGTSRGVAYWTDKKEKRIFFTSGDLLYALDATTGKPIESFGQKGHINLRLGLPDAHDKFISSTTPGTVFENLIIMPIRVSEDAQAAPGDIRAFDVHTGQLVWSFRTIPAPGDAGYESWDLPLPRESGKVGAANNWAGMALDPQNEILFVPTGSVAPDFWGGDRPGDNLFANSLLALHVRTGKKIWHYQFTRHDLWDRDLPAPPNLITVTQNGKKIPAVAQITKQGYVFVFNRLTGKPLFPIKEVAVPQSPLPGETTSPTQPLPVLPKPFARQSNLLTADSLSPYAPDLVSLKNRFNLARKGLYEPPGTTDEVLLLPGYDGGAEWGGAAADPHEGVLYVNANEMAWFLQLQPYLPDQTTTTPGEKAYQLHCAVCHQTDRSGLPSSGFPSLKEINRKWSAAEIENQILNGKGMMPGFSHLPEKEIKALVNYLTGNEKQEVVSDTLTASYQPPYQHKGYEKFLDANGLPAIQPPWGTLHAIDLNTGKFRWSVTLGDTPQLREKGFPPTGTENYGGPLVTENGLLMIAATKDGFFRIFDKETGRLLWEYSLPAASFATPSTYSINGKQYIVLACGGEKLGTPKGNTIMAFALEE